MSAWLAGKTAITTGAGRGIGRAAAELLAEEGANVLITDIDEQPAADSVSRLRESGANAHALAGDVTSPDFPAQLIDATLKHFGRLDILVNNAGFTWDG